MHCGKERGDCMIASFPGLVYITFLLQILLFTTSIHIYFTVSSDVSSPQDTLISTLESNLERYQVLGSLTADEGTKVKVLEQSLGSHEQALGSLKTEYQRKQKELREAEEEVKKLRTAVAEKVLYTRPGNEVIMQSPLPFPQCTP